jgi:superfamily II DNA/RNA helicase
MTPMPTFSDLGLTPKLLAALAEVGYEAPTPIQARTIPALLAGRDVIGQAQTGTGKTAAFALPILQTIDLKRAEVQALVLTPTRELAIQVAEAIHTYGKGLGPLRVLPVYGGQGMQISRRNSGEPCCILRMMGRPAEMVNGHSCDLLGASCWRPRFYLDQAEAEMREIGA